MWFKTLRHSLSNATVSYLAPRLVLDNNVIFLNRRFQAINYTSRARLCLKTAESHEDITPDTRLIKVAIVGVPNAGKSTVINQLVGQQVCSASSKVHTTRFKAQAVLNEGNTQIVFVDTPGLVGAVQAERHSLEKSFLKDGESAASEADILCVIHDAANKWTRDELDDGVLQLLRSHNDKRSLLVLNKVDLMRSKRKLLDLVGLLMCKTNEENAKGWPNFEQTFMISALTGSGLPELKDYLLASAVPAPWLFSADIATDQSTESLVEHAVRAALLDNLPQEVPYRIRPMIEHLHRSADGTLTAVVLIGCATKRVERMVVGAKGLRVKAIAQAAEQQLESAFNTRVVLKLVLTDLKM